LIASSVSPEARIADRTLLMRAVIFSSFFLTSSLLPRPSQVQFVFISSHWAQVPDHRLMSSSSICQDSNLVYAGNLPEVVYKSTVSPRLRWKNRWRKFERCLVSLWAK